MRSKVSGATVTSLGHNLIGNNSGSETVFLEGTHPNGDQVGTAIAPLDPLLGALLDNGGPTLTSMPDPDSPLVDQGSCPGETEDQRGYSNFDTNLRPVTAGTRTTTVGNGDYCDIGSVERLATPTDTFVRDGFERL